MKCPLSCINAISTLGWLTGSTKVQLHGVPLCTKLRLFVLCMSRGAFSLLFMDFWRISDLEDSALIPSASSFGPCSASILGEHLSHLWLIHFQIRGSVHFDVTKAEKDVLSCCLFPSRWCQDVYKVMWEVDCVERACASKHSGEAKGFKCWERKKGAFAVAIVN